MAGRRTHTIPLPGFLRSGRSVRILSGLGLVALLGVADQFRLEQGWSNLAWPNAALWAAAGWGLSGLAIRPMLLLVLIGLAQDIVLRAPLGAFVVVNLAAFGTAAFLTRRQDRDGGTARGLLFGFLAILAGFAALTALAVTANEGSPRLPALIADVSVTLIGFVLVFPLFNLPASDEHMFRGRT